MGRGCSRQGRVARLVTVDFRGSIQGDHLRLRSSLLEVEPGGALSFPSLRMLGYRATSSWDLPWGHTGRAKYLGSWEGDTGGLELVSTPTGPPQGILNPPHQCLMSQLQEQAMRPVASNLIPS